MCDHPDCHPMTEEERADHDRISAIKDFWEWHYANSDFWTRYYRSHP